MTDLAVGADGDDTGGARRGAVHVLLMNSDGTVKSTIEIDDNTANGPTLADFDSFGVAMASLGDLDGDGVTDLAVGAYQDDTGGANYNGGAVHVLLMNSNGTVKSTIKIDDNTANGPTLAVNDFFGHAVASLGDLDGDGVTDLAVGADRDDTGGENRGAVHVLLMNSDGTVKSTIKIDDNTANGPTLADRDYFGRAMASLGDLDGDGVTDLAVGADRDDTGGDSRGAVHVLLLNSNGTVKSTTKMAHQFNGGPTLADRDFFGSAVASLGDLDGDGVTELAVGAYGDDTGGSLRGAVHVLFLKPLVPDQIGVTRASGGNKQFFRDLNGNGLFDSGSDANTFFGLATDETIVGDWNNDGLDDIGVVRANGGNKQFFRDLNGNGSFDAPDSISFFGLATDQTIIGDWDGDGDDDIGVVRANGGNKQFFRDLNGNGNFDSGVDANTFFGLATDQTIIGDWDGNGTDDVGVTRSNAGNKQFFRDLNGNGNFDSGVDASTFFGLATDETIVGDWNGDGTDDVGVTRAFSGNKAFFRDLNGNGSFDSGIDAFTSFGIASDATIVGDWDGDGDDDVGVTRSVSGNKRFFRDLNGNGTFEASDANTAFGIASDAVIIGGWSLPQPLSASAGEAADPVADAPLTTDQLQPIVTAAIDLLAATNLSAAQLAQLTTVEVYIADLSGARLGQASGNMITIDVNAAGYGWFIDTTPDDHGEFTLTSDVLLAIGESAAAGQMDLLTVVLHELGHVLGLDDEYSVIASTSLMNGWLDTGIRRLTTAGELAAILAGE